MRHVTPLTSYADAIAAVRKAISWIESLGVTVENTRFFRVSRTLEALQRAWLSSSAEVESLIADRGTDALVEALTDAYELHQIRTGLEGLRDPGLVRRLRKFVKGPDHQSKEDKSRTSTTQGRDFGFELSVGSFFSCAGFGVTFPDTGDVTVHCRYARVRRIFIECKRPKSPDSGQSNVASALKQLEQRYTAARKPQRVRGIVALSTSKASNPSGLLLQAVDAGDLRRQLERHVGAMHEATQSYWFERAGPKTLGCLLEFRCAAQVGDQLVPSSQFGLQVRGDTGSDNRRVGDAIGRQLRKLDRSAE